MRLGVSSSLGAKSAAEWGKLNKELGLGTVVFPLNCRASEEEINAYVAEARAQDLTIAEVGVWCNAIDADPDKAKANLEYSIGQLELADKIGARCCVNVAGAYSGKRWDGAHVSNFSEDARKKTVKMVQDIIDAVNPKNTYFSLEPMPWMIPTSPEEYLRLIDEVDRDRFLVHMDIINMINCPERYFYGREFLEKTFELLKGKIRSCHLKDVLLLEDFTFRLRECAPGEGTFDLKRYIELANAEDPDMPMIIEHLTGDDEYRESVLFVQNLLKQ